MTSSPLGLLLAALAVVFVAETLVMLFLMPALVPHRHGFPGATIDASIMASFSAPFIWWLIARRHRSEQALRVLERVTSSTLGLLLASLAVVFVVEHLVMWLLMPALVPGHYGFLGATIDAGLMASFSAPFMWWLIARRRRAEEALRIVNQELEAERQRVAALNRSLEKKVRERTQDVRLANEELTERNRQLLDVRAQAATDALTGLPNHRAFQEGIRDEVRSAEAEGASVGLIMLDIDGFKGVNDSLGHLEGDRLLRGLALTLAEAVAQDRVYRYGGDEFVVVLPKADHRTTGGTAERLRRAVETSLDVSGEKQLTVSLGVASFPHSADSVEELIYGADVAMYWAKSAGKNRVGDWSRLVRHRADKTLPRYAADRAAKQWQPVRSHRR